MKPHILVQTDRDLRKTKKLVVRHPGGALVMIDFRRPERGDLSPRPWEYISRQKSDLEPVIELRGMSDLPVQIIINDWTLRLAAHIMGNVVEFVVQRGIDAPWGAKTGFIAGSDFVWYSTGKNVQVDLCPIIPIRRYEQQVV